VKLDNLYYPPDTDRVMKLKGMSFAVHTAHMGKIRIEYKILLWNPEGMVSLWRHTRG
jgi:hypothetical protein